MNGAEEFKQELPEADLKEFDNEDLYDIDFSNVSGKDFKKSFSNVKKQIKKVRIEKAKPGKSKKFIDNKKKRVRITRISVPSNRMLTVEGIDKYITSGEYDWSKDIEHYKGERLKQVIINFDNSNSLVDVTLDLFDPSSMIDYLQSNTQNINNQITVADGVVKYSDVLFNLLANPLMIINAKFILAGSNISEQTNQTLTFKNKNVEGWLQTIPMSLAMQINVYQKQRTVICFNLLENITRPFIPDGMDVLQYTVLAGSSVNMIFYAKQHSLKKLLFEEADKAKKLL